MPRRLLLGALALGSVFVAGACGDDDTVDAASTTVTTAAPAPTTNAPSTSASATSAPPTTAAAATTTAPSVLTIDFTVGVDPLGEVIEVPLGTDVAITVMSDGDEEVHVHGYDLEARAAAGTPAVITFTADQAGSFEVESHTTHDVLFVLEVS